MQNDDRRIVVEVLTPSEVARLEGKITDIKSEIDSLSSRLDGLHRTLYDVLSSLRRAR